MTAPKKFTPVELPWHQRLEARVASALGLLVAVALGAVLLVTLSVVSAQSRDRVAAELEVARTAFYTLLDIRIASADRCGGSWSPSCRRSARTSPTAGSPAIARRMNALADGPPRADAGGASPSSRGPMAPGSAAPAGPTPSGTGANVVRDAQHAARGGRAQRGAGARTATGCSWSSSVPARARRRPSLGTLTVGYRAHRRHRRRAGRGWPAARWRSWSAARSWRRAWRRTPGRDADALRAGDDDGAGRQARRARAWAGGSTWPAVFPLKPDMPGGDAGRLLVLSDWAADAAVHRHAACALRAGRRRRAGLCRCVGGVFLSRHLSRPLRDIATAADRNCRRQPLAAAAGARHGRGRHGGPGVQRDERQPAHPPTSGWCTTPFTTI